MGFSNRGYGVVHPCWINGGQISYLDGLNKTRSFPCTIDVNIPKQLNIFYSTEVAFYLEKDNDVYIGRYDGFISIYKKCSDRLLLTGLQHWDPPELELDVAGYKRGHSVLYPIYVDKSDCQTLYCAYLNAEGHLRNPFKGEFLTDCRVVEALSSTVDKQFSVFSEGGDLLETDVWLVQESLWRRDCKVFL